LATRALPHPRRLPGQPDRRPGRFHRRRRRRHPAPPRGSTAATIDYTAKFLTEARGDHLIARAHVLRPGITLTVAAVDISVARNGTETLCAAAFVTMRNITNSARSAPDAV